MLSQRGSLQYQTYSLLDFVKRCQFIRYGFLWSSILSSGCPTRTQRYKSQICIAQSLQFNSYLPHLLQVTLIQVTTMRVSTFIAFIALVLSGVSAAAAPAEGYVVLLPLLTRILIQAQNEPTAATPILPVQWGMRIPWGLLQQEVWLRRCLRHYLCIIHDMVSLFVHPSAISCTYGTSDFERNLTWGTSSTYLR